MPPFIANRAKAVLTYLADLLPVRRRTIYNNRAMPLSIASSLTVDRVQEILRAAETGNTLDLFVLYQDIIASGSHLQGRLSDRKEAVLSDTLSVQPFNKENPDDVAAADLVRSELVKHENWELACSHLLDSVLWPVSLVEKTYKPSTKPGLRYQLATLTPVPYQLITYIHGYMELWETDPETGHPIGVRFVPDPARYIIHRGHLLTALPDNWGGPMRSLIFWWLLGHMDRDWWARFLDRYGAPFVVGKYDQGDDDSRAVLERAFALAVKLGGLVVTRETEVEIKQAAASDSGDAYDRFIEVCNREISKLILGETLSSDAQATGMGSGASKAHSQKRDEKRAGDARRLGATLRNGLVTQFLQINGMKGQPPLLIWGSVSPEEMQATRDLLTALTAGGLEVADEGLLIISDRLGLPVQRAQRPPPVASAVQAFSATRFHLAHHATDMIAEASAEELGKVFIGELAPMRGIILKSKTPEEAIRGCETFCARFDPPKSARIMAQVLQAVTANAAAATAR